MSSSSRSRCHLERKSVTAVTGVRTGQNEDDASEWMQSESLAAESWRRRVVRIQVYE